MVRTVPLLALAFVVLLTACTPSSDTSSTTAATTAETATTTTTATSTTEAEDLEPPERGDPEEVATDAFWDAGDFELTDDPDLFDEDALTAIEQWLPEDLVDGLIWEVFHRGSNHNVLAVSAIPSLTWRGDPNFVPALFETLTDVEAPEVAPGIFEAQIPTGPVIFGWSTGDGFIVATSLDSDQAVDYLEALASETGPQSVWEPGSCLYVDPDTETLPYAPFPPDIVVPCNGAHNAEVLISELVGTELDAFDDEAIMYERNYVCDKAYTDVFGAQKDHKPALITYMPDQDEWDRGDRYLACVVQLDTTDGPVLMAGSMSDRTDLDWAPEPETCLDVSLAPESVDCGRSHGYQYLGDATVPFDAWPTEGAAAFTDACQALLDSFVRPGPATVDVFASGLYPYAFEHGDRTVRCMGFALEDGLLVEVAGSFADVWRVIGSDGIAA